MYFDQTQLSLSRLDLRKESQFYEEIMRVDKSHKFMGFMMNVCGNTAMLMYGNTSQICLTIYH